MNELGNHTPEDAAGLESSEETNPLEYPEGLSEKDIELINLQCENQEATTPEQISGFADAYVEAKKIVLDNDELQNLDSDNLFNLLLHWAASIEPRNEKGFRTTPVAFPDGSTGLSPQAIPRQVGLLIEQFIEKGQTPIEIYKWFEEIHPFEDGNGRVGDILWKLSTAHQGEEWPEELPPDIFSEQADPTEK